METQTKLVLHKPYRAMDVANYLVQHFIDQHRPINNTLLLKILYYLQADSLRQSNVPLFEDTIKKWGYGPIVPHVYSYFKSYGAAPITQMMEYVVINADNSWGLIKPSKRTLAPADIHQINKLADEICLKYQDKEFQLVKLSCKDPLWQESKAEIEHGNMDIPYTNKEIAEYFSKPDKWYWKY